MITNMKADNLLLISLALAAELVLTEGFLKGFNRKCPQMFRSALYPESCSLVVKMPMSWKEADSYCKSLNATLLIPPAVNQLTKKKLANGAYWVGLTQDHEGKQEWINKRPFTTTKTVKKQINSPATTDKPITSSASPRKHSLTSHTTQLHIATSHTTRMPFLGMLTTMKPVAARSKKPTIPTEDPLVVHVRKLAKHQTPRYVERYQEENDEHSSMCGAFYGQPPRWIFRKCTDKIKAICMIDHVKRSSTWKTAGIVVIVITAALMVGLALSWLVCVIVRDPRRKSNKPDNKYEPVGDGIEDEPSVSSRMLTNSNHYGSG